MTTKSLKIFVIICVTTIIISFLIIFNLSIVLEFKSNPTPAITERYINTHSIINYTILPTDKLIIGNPLKLPKCRNAILNKENIDIIDLLTTHLPQIYNVASHDPLIKRMVLFLVNRSIPQLWGREQLNALKNNVEWWSGARAHVSYDPFWYFARKIDKNNDFQKKQLEWQYNKIDQVQNDLNKEREPWYFERIHFTDLYNDTNINMKPLVVDYEWNELISLDGYVNTYLQHSVMPQVAYYHIPKCGSTSMRWMLESIGGTRIEWRQSWFEGYPLPDILHKNIECGFTFVRHPIHRFISAYYTFNHMLQFDLKQSKSETNLKLIETNLKYWNIVDECYYNYSCLKRINVFVDELVSDSWKWINNYENIYSTRVMEHIGSMTGHFMASYDLWNISFVGKLEYFEKHWIELSKNINECSVGYLDKYWNNSENIRHNFNFADIKPWTKLSSGLKSTKQDKNTNKTIEHRLNHMGQKGKKTLNRTLVDAYYAFALNKRLYEKLVDYYYQDFVCFGYDMTYQSFLKYIMEKDPSFDRRDFPQNMAFS